MARLGFSVVREALPLELASGNNRITPRGEKMRLYAGDAFDLAGERKRTAFRVDSSNKWLGGSFEILLRAALQAAERAKSRQPLE